MFFLHIFGIIIPIDVHIFQRGSNHQADDLSSNLAAGSEDVLNTLNGFGLGASDVFVKLVSRLGRRGVHG